MERLGQQRAALFIWHKTAQKTLEVYAEVVSAHRSRGGRDIRYDWDFGADETASDPGPTLVHVYAAPGRYQVTLRVTDNEGCSADGQARRRSGFPADADQYTAGPGMVIAIAGHLHEAR